MRLAARTAGPRLVSPTFLLVMASTFAYFVQLGALAPTLPLFVKGPLGGDDFGVGVAIGTFSLSAVLLRPWIGSIGDRHGRRVLIVAGAVTAGLSVLSYNAAESLAQLLFLRLFTGFGEAAFYVGAASVINDLAPDDRRGEAVSYFSLALFSGLAVGPMVGEGLLRAAGFDVAWTVAALFAGAAAAIGLFVPETRPDSAGRNGARVIHPAALVPGAVLATSIWGLSTFTAFVPLHALGIGLSGSRFVFVEHSLILLAIRSVGARIPDVLGPKKCARMALAISAIGLAEIALWQQPAGLYLGTAIYSIGHSLAFPALMTMAVRRADASERGAVIGTFTAFFDASFGLAALSAGGIATVLGYPGAFAGAAAVALLGLTSLSLRGHRVAAR